MVALLETAEYLHQVFISALADLCFKGVEFIEGLPLKFVTEPGGGVALFICP